MRRLSPVLRSALLAIAGVVVALGLTFVLGILVPLYGFYSALALTILGIAPWVGRKAPNGVAALLTTLAACLVLVVLAQVDARRCSGWDCIGAGVGVMVAWAFAVVYTAATALGMAIRRQAGRAAGSDPLAKP